MRTAGQRLFVRTLLAVLLATGLTGCSHADVGGGIVSGERGSLVVDGPHRIEIKPTGAPSAIVSDKPAFVVQGKPVALDASQRHALLAYYSSVRQLSRRGNDTTWASVEMVGSIFRGIGHLITGSTDKETLQQNIRNRVSGFLNQRIGPICSALAGLFQAQDRLKQTLPAFTPYAIIEQNDVQNCRRSITTAQNNAS